MGKGGGAKGSAACVDGAADATLSDGSLRGGGAPSRIVGAASGAAVSGAGELLHCASVTSGLLCV